MKWNYEGQDITLTQTTRYPEAEEVSLTLKMARPSTFSLSLRVPEWAQNVSVSINGRAQKVAARSGQWLELKREWKSGDRVSLHLPLPVREVPIDAQHPGRIAYARGPVVLVRPIDATVRAPDAGPTSGMLPFSQIGENGRYTMYFDPPTVDLVATSEKSGALWRWTSEKPVEDWSTPGFDARAWKEGAAPFGTQGSTRTQWSTPDIWMRREVTLPAGPIKNPQLRMFYDEDTEVYFNGVLAARTTGFSTSYQTIEISPAAKAQIRPGARLSIAVHVRQTTGSQLIDLGLVDERPRPAIERRAV